MDSTFVALSGVVYILFLVFMFYLWVYFLRWVFMVDKIHQLLKDSHETQKKLLNKIAWDSGAERRERWEEEDKERLKELEGGEDDK